MSCLACHQLDNCFSRKGSIISVLSVRPYVRQYVRHPFISGATHRNFLKFCIKLDINKVRKVTKLKFSKKTNCTSPSALLRPPTGVQNGPFWPKNQHFSKYLKNTSLDFFHIWHDLEPDKGLKLDYVFYFRKFMFAGGKGSKVKFLPNLALFGVI